MSANILPFARNPGLDDVDPPLAAVTWSVAELPGQRECSDWLMDVLVHAPTANTALSLWTHHPNLRACTERLASFITPKWPHESGEPLLAVAARDAVNRADEAIRQGQAFEGRLVGLYLFGLLKAHRAIGQFLVRGTDRQGQVRQWQHFSVPLKAWACSHGIDKLVLSRADNATEAFFSGLYVHMLAAIATPTEAGYLAKHAPLG